MAAGKYNIYIEQGATWRFAFVWKDSTGQPRDLTGWSARMMIRESYDSKKIILNLSTQTGGHITITPGTWLVSIEVPAIDTAKISIEKGVYDIELVSPSGLVVRILQGKATINPEVTK